MSHRYTAELEWLRGEQRFTDNLYSRRHRLRFDGGIELDGSSSPLVVPEPMSDACAVDPEELFVAALASCHMLWFLGIAAKRRLCVDRYFDPAYGVMGKDEAGREMIREVVLRPEVIFAGDRQPERALIERIHHQAHQACFIANSVRSEVRCEPCFIV
ncbi:OsmC family protein [Halotalea alkalilenta]|uniref:OsmC family protein n=1 Tax=Halotalea alkalilenta TaxID=376489 RepID=UPI000485DB9F|nr:OsmC family protein [Halotalea alkalilenta]